MGFVMKVEISDCDPVLANQVSLSLVECLVSWLGGKSSFLCFFLVCDNKTKMEKGERNCEKFENQNKVNNK